MVDIKGTLKECLKSLDMMVFGDGQENIYPAKQGLNEEAWENLQITKRAISWDQEGGLCVIEWRSDGATGIAIKRERRIQC